ncbi:hypothetical protein [Clostridium algidicarnis]|uniref:DUF7922 domain-containing protein n=1 Tax=Clostridium algidicarnis TaxID=37659 RepID=UPI001C0CFC52|nr:hypothetical protein [Clostridium algidicarnis]MBU3193248.1 hypothetical protein [Clostridium algidicarnis]MBU3206558.1 hypothetical protein [Clostridium algidicarnis]
MAHKKSYSRYFVILQEDEKGCALASDKQPSGYSKIELKNEKLRMSYYVQNLKREDNPYYMLIVCNKRDVNKIINIGVLNIDDNGRADVSYEFDADNIGGTGIALEDIGGTAILKRSNSKRTIPMSGFLSSDKPKNWKEYDILEIKLNRDVTENKMNKDNQSIIIKKDVEISKDSVKEDNKKKDKTINFEERKIENKPEIEVNILNKKAKEKSSIRDTKKNIEENIETFKDEVKEIKEDINNKEGHEHRLNLQENFNEYEDNIERIKQKKLEVADGEEDVNLTYESEIIEEIDNEDILHKKEEDVFCEREDDGITDNREDEEFLEDRYNKKHCGLEKDKCATADTEDFFEGIVKGFESVNGFENQIKYCAWYKVPTKNIESLLNNSNYTRYTVIYYPMINYYPYIKKYEHYMVGYKYNKDNRLRYIVYAVPGTKDRREQPYGGKTGFITWMPSKTDENFGYWLMFYDFRNSITVVPMK